MRDPRKLAHDEVGQRRALERGSCLQRPVEIVRDVANLDHFHVLNMMTCGEHVKVRIRPSPTPPYGGSCSPGRAGCWEWPARLGRVQARWPPTARPARMAPSRWVTNAAAQRGALRRACGGAESGGASSRSMAGL